MRAYEKMTANENLGWCKPYEIGDMIIAMSDGEIVGCQIGGVDHDEYVRGNAAIEELAKKYNESYSDYSGWSDLYILLDGARELGCASCPWRDMCEAMECDDDE